MVRWAQVVALLLVAWGIVHSVRQASRQLAQQQSQLNAQADEVESQINDTLSSEQRAVITSQAEKIRSRARNFWQASPLWLALAGAAYASGTLCAGWFWRESLQRLSQPAPLGKTLYAYCLGHLGKYFRAKLW